jgi:hypothetical protein
MPEKARSIYIILDAQCPTAIALQSFDQLNISSSPGDRIGAQLLSRERFCIADHGNGFS